MIMKTIPLTILALAFSLTAVSAQDGQPPQITVSGTAEVLVAPDEAIIHVGVEIRNENLDQVRHLHDDRMKSALTFLKSSGVPDKNVQTDFINLTTDSTSSDSWKTKTIAYVARTSIEVKLTNVTNLEKILSGLLNSGVDRINYVEFRTSQLRKYRDQARGMAIQAAKEKADALCADLGVKRGKPLNINASESGGWLNPYGSYWGARNYGMASNAQVSVQDTEGTSDSTNDTLSVGQISVSATVNVSFALQD